MDALIGRDELMETCGTLFDELVSGAGRVLLHDTRLQLADSDEQQSIIMGSREFWNGVVDYFSRNPEQLYNVHPRRFEELVAELLVREGLRVELTPAMKDGGADVLAFADTPVGRHLYLVECKKYAQSNPVVLLC